VNINRRALNPAVNRDFLIIFTDKDRSTNKVVYRDDDRLRHRFLIGGGPLADTPEKWEQLETRRHLTSWDNPENLEDFLGLGVAGAIVINLSEMALRLLAYSDESWFS
jgi:hypothetical protein